MTKEDIINALNSSGCYFYEGKRLYEQDELMESFEKNGLFDEMNHEKAKLWKEGYDRGYATGLKDQGLDFSPEKRKEDIQFAYQRGYDDGQAELQSFTNGDHISREQAKEEVRKAFLSLRERVEINTILNGLPSVPDSEDAVKDISKELTRLGLDNFNLSSEYKYYLKALNDVQKFIDKMEG